MAEAVPPTFRSSVTRLVGADATRWLGELPALEAELAGRWGLELGEPLPGGLLASVRGVRRSDGSEAVLKLAGWWDRTADEIACLKRWDGGPTPLLLAADTECSAILLERIAPGRRALDATAEGVAPLLRQLQLADPGGLPPLDGVVRRRLDRAERDRRAQGPRLAWARDAVERLAGEGRPSVVVHGDFDDRNLLVCGRRGLCAIDPLPCAGDGAYDAAYWVHANRRPGRRARFEAIASELALDRGRLRDWCAVIAVHG